MSKFMIYFSLIYLCSDVFFTCSQQSLNENINIKITCRYDYAGVDIIQMRIYYRLWSDNNWNVSYNAIIEMHSCGSFVYTRWPFTSSINLCSTFYAFISLCEVSISYKSSGEFFQPKHQVHQYWLCVVKCFI